jgi:hypothetical protein
MSDDLTRSLPSVRRLVVATAVACAVAMVILVAAVLPAEYGIDPLGTGSALGLLRSDASEALPAVDAAGAAGLVPQLRGPSAEYGSTHRTDTVEFDLGPYEYLEYKYRLAQGATMVYSWQASAAVIHDFHGAPGDGGPEVSIDRSTRTRGSGSLTAPFAGLHGWYWENPGWTPITISLTSAGFYGGALESRSNRTQRTHEPAPVLPGAADPDPVGRASGPPDAEPGK